MKREVNWGVTAPKSLLREKIGPPPHVDLTREIKIQNAVRDLIRKGLLKGAHDCSEGGLGVALAECCFNPERLRGGDRSESSRNAAASAQRVAVHIIISVDADNVERTMSILREDGVPFQQLGKVGGNDLRIRVNDETLRPVTDLHDDWFNAIRRVVEDETKEFKPSL